MIKQKEEYILSKQWKGRRFKTRKIIERTKLSCQHYTS